MSVSPRKCLPLSDPTTRQILSITTSSLSNEPPPMSDDDVDDSGDDDSDSEGGMLASVSAASSGNDSSHNAMTSASTAPCGGVDGGDSAKGDDAELASHVLVDGHLSALSTQHDVDSILVPTPNCFVTQHGRGVFARGVYWVDQKRVLVHFCSLACANAFELAPTMLLRAFSHSFLDWKC